MPENMKTVGKRLAETREALELSPARLCERIDCKANRWSQYENGERMVTMVIANRLCDEFRLSLDWIYRADPSSLPNRLRAKIKSATKAA